MHRDNPLNPDFLQRLSLRDTIEEVTGDLACVCSSNVPLRLIDGEAEGFQTKINAPDDQDIVGVASEREQPESLECFDCANAERTAMGML
jgi:hypothetical protein